MNASTLMWGMVFGSIGLGFFTYGKKQRVVIPLISGVTLMLIPYFFSNVFVLILIGVLLMCLPFLIKR